MARIRTLATPIGSLPKLRGWTNHRGFYESSHPDEMDPADREHWIYFIQGDDGGPVKIGKTTDLKYRLIDLQIGYPFGELGYCALIRGKRDIERQLHERFAAFAMRGEWFIPGMDLEAFILSLPEPA